MYTLPSILPSLFDWAFWVPFFFRLFLAFQLYREARRLMQGGEDALVTEGMSAPTPSAKKTLAWVMMLLSFLFFIGFGVQVIAVFTSCAYLLRMIQVSKRQKTDALQSLLFLSALVSFSLLFLGPGPYAVDLPL